MDDEEKKEVIEDVVEEDTEEKEEEPDPEPEQEPEAEPEPTPEEEVQDNEVMRKLDSIIESIGLVSKAVAQLGIARQVDMTPDVTAAVTEDTTEPKEFEDMDFSLDTGGGSDDEDELTKGNYLD